MPAACAFGAAALEERELVDRRRIGGIQRERPAVLGEIRALQLPVEPAAAVVGVLRAVVGDAPVDRRRMRSDFAPVDCTAGRRARRHRSRRAHSRAVTAAANFFKIVPFVLWPGYLVRDRQQSGRSTAGPTGPSFGRLSDLPLPSSSSSRGPQRRTRTGAGRDEPRFMPSFPSVDRRLPAVDRAGASAAFQPVNAPRIFPAPKRTGSSAGNPVSLSTAAIAARAPSSPRSLVLSAIAATRAGLAGSARRSCSSTSSLSGGIGCGPPPAPSISVCPGGGRGGADAARCRERGRGHAGVDGMDDRALALDPQQATVPPVCQALGPLDRRAVPPRRR